VLRDGVDAVHKDGQLGLHDRGERLERVDLGGRVEGHALANVVLEGFAQFDLKDHFWAKLWVQLRTVIQSPA